MIFFTGALSHIAIYITPLACVNPPLEMHRLFLYMISVPARVQLVNIRWPWYLRSAGANMKSMHQYGKLPYFPRTMTYKDRSPVTKTCGLTELHIVFALGGERGQPWVRILKCILSSCVQPRNRPAQIFFSLYHIGAMTVFPRISPLSLLQFACESLEIMVMFLPDVKFSLSFMLALNAPHPWSLPIIM